MVDKIKPLKLEDTGSGSMLDNFPTETNPAEDYVAAKGVALENSDNTTIRGDSGVMKFKDTDITAEKSLQDLVSSASPGFIFGRKGNTGAGTWAENEGVPSNTVGIPILVNSPQLSAVYAINENDPETFTVEIYEHDGVTFTLKHTISVTADRGNFEILSSPVSLTQGKELAVKQSSGSSKNLKVVCLISGDTIA